MTTTTLCTPHRQHSEQEKKRLETLRQRTAAALPRDRGMMSWFSSSDEERQLKDLSVNIDVSETLQT